MAQGQLPAKPCMGAGDAPTAEEIRQIQQCEKLLHFRDEVLSGIHPRIKPAHLVAKQRTPSSSSNIPISNPTIPAATQPSQEANTNGRSSHVVDNMRSFQANLQRPSVSASLQGLGVPSSGVSSATPASSLPRLFGSGKTEIDPILLEKSDDLIKAEIQLQRVRLERGLREQFEQRRAVAKASLQAPEPLADFDLADVLSRALALVQSTAAQSTDETAANASASSDSFDDNTFYSSQHDTPEPPSEPAQGHMPSESEGEQMRDSSPYEPELDPQPVALGLAAQISETNVSSQLDANSLLQRNPPSAAYPQNSHLGANLRPNTENEQSSITRIPGLQTIQGTGAADSRDSGEASRSKAPPSMGKKQSEPRRPHQANQQVLDNAFGDARYIRAHNLSPIAPQPAHVSPLALAREPPVAQQQEPEARRATPPQVAALRKGPSAATSPESSTQGNKGADKKKPKKKKRKAERQAVEGAAASPFIKPEPRSASPLSGPHDVRPAKRQRQALRPQDGLHYDEPRYEQPMPIDDGYGQRYQPRSFREERGLAQNDRPVDLQPRHEAQPVAASAARYDMDYYEERPPPPAQFARPPSQTAYRVEYGPGEGRGVHQPVSYDGVEQPYHRDVPAQYRNMREDPRMSVRPGMDRERSRSPVIYERPVSVMPPPRAAPTRIFVDDFGREYIEPPRPVPVVRQSVGPGAPAVRAVESDVQYGRPAPPHPASRRPETFEENGIVYRRASPPYIPQRRVVTQPELAGPDYRAYREREYSARLMAPPGNGYAPSRVHPESRLIAEPPREYVARASSVRPVGEGIRYEVAGGYDTRVGGDFDRNLPARAVSVRPAETLRYEAPQGYERRVVDSRGDYLRTGSARPSEPVRYEFARGYRPGIGSIRPDIDGREYAATVHPETRSEVMAPPAEGRAFSVRPGDAGLPVARPEYRLRRAESYYERPLVRGEEEVIYVDHAPRPDAYHQA